MFGTEPFQSRSDRRILKSCRFFCLTEMVFEISWYFPGFNFVVLLKSVVAPGRLCFLLTGIENCINILVLTGSGHIIIDRDLVHQCFSAGGRMKKIFFFSLLSLILSAGAADGHMISDGNGGFFTADGAHVISDGNGGFYMPNGDHVRSDGNNGFYTPKGDHFISDGQGGLMDPDGGHYSSDGQGGFFMPDGTHVIDDGGNGFFVE